jgi:hypothetical protein
VGEYRARYRDALRNDAGGDEPLLIRNALGIYGRAEEVRSNDLRLDWLFSFQPPAPAP